MELVDKLQLKSGDNILDVGCGDGKITAQIAKKMLDSTMEIIPEMGQTKWYISYILKTLQGEKIKHIKQAGCHPERNAVILSVAKDLFAIIMEFAGRSFATLRMTAATLKLTVAALMITQLRIPKFKTLQPRTFFIHVRARARFLYNIPLSHLWERVRVRV